MPSRQGLCDYAAWMRGLVWGDLTVLDHQAILSIIGGGLLVPFIFWLLRPRISVRIDSHQPVAIAPEKPAVVKVHVNRWRYSGKLVLSIGGLSEGLSAEPSEILFGVQDGQISLSANSGALFESVTVQVVAGFENVHATAPLQVKLVGRHGREPTPKSDETDQGTGRANPYRDTPPTKGPINPPPVVVADNIGLPKLDGPDEDEVLDADLHLPNLRHQFWNGLLAEVKRRGLTRFANIAPSWDNNIKQTAGKPGMRFVYVILKDSPRLELEIDTPGGQENNERIFNILSGHRDAIEDEIRQRGIGPLEWDQVKDRKYQLIKCEVQSGGLGLDAGERNWPQIYGAMIDAMEKFAEVMEPRIQAMLQN